MLLTGAAAFVVASQVVALSRAQSERQQLDTARALSLVVDAKLQSYRSLLSALKGAEAIREGDWARFAERAREALPEPDAWILLTDHDGRELVNTQRPADAGSPSGATSDHRAALNPGREHVCNLSRGVGEPQTLCVETPVLREGRPPLALAVVFRPRLLDDVLSRPRLREGHFVTVLDREQVVIWRNIAADRFVGRLATADLRAAIRQHPDGVMTSVSLDGVPTVVSYSRSPLSGWTFVVAVPQSEIVGHRQLAVGYGLAAAAGLLLLAGLFGLWAGGRIIRAVGRLSEAATRFGGGRPPAYQAAGFTEIDAVGHALAAALAQREADHERLRLAQDVGGVGAWEWDAPNDLGHVSEAYRAMHGLPDVAGPLKLAEILAVIHPDDVAGFKARIVGAVRADGPSSSEYRVVWPDGSVRWLYAKGRPVRAPDGALASAIGVVIDVTERRESEERLKFLMSEVDHRANNLLTVVQSAVTLSRAPEDGELRRVILGRIEALAHAHQLLAGSRWAGADLRRLIEVETNPYKLGDEAKVELEGDAIPVSPAAAQGLALAIHELATNAAKYGALSTPAGHVVVRWWTDDGRLRLRWTEIGGPPVVRPARRGFGTAVIQRALQGPLGGTSRITWLAEGLVCDLELPLGP
ncbi:MAG: HWE histidine kinase domain-containing protein [Phenylobacterium sp.]|nr:HWE histidine kinase domain-containing protein [Phenylobacterium sp.]